MGGEQHLQPAAQPLAEEQVARLGGLGALQGRTRIEPQDSLQRSRDSVGIAGELDRLGVCEKLALAAHRGLDQVAEEGSQEADKHQAQTRA